jgi:hypothetical protein
MTMSRPGVVCALLLAAMGCAGGQNPAPAVATTPYGMCVTETPIGSHMPRRTCRSNAQVDAERRAAQDTLDNIRTAPSVPEPQH